MKLSISEKIMQSLFLSFPTLFFGIITFFIIYIFYDSIYGWIIAATSGFSTYYFGEKLIRLWKEY